MCLCYLLFLGEFKFCLSLCLSTKCLFYRLVEEFMLLANMAVARKIYQHFPDIAVLRRHPKPQERMLNDLVSLSSCMGIDHLLLHNQTLRSMYFASPLYIKFLITPTLYIGESFITLFDNCINMNIMYI